MKGFLVLELFTALRDLPPIIDIDLHLHLFLKNKNIGIFYQIFFKNRIIFPCFEQGSIKKFIKQW